MELCYKLSQEMKCYRDIMKQKWEELAAEEKQLKEKEDFLKKSDEENALSMEAGQKKVIELNPEGMKKFQELQAEKTMLLQQKLSGQDTQLVQKQQELAAKEKQLLEEDKEFLNRNPDLLTLIMGLNEQREKIVSYAINLQAQRNDFMRKKIGCMEEQSRVDKDEFEKQKQVLAKELQRQQEIDTRLLLLGVFAVLAEILDRVVEYKFNYKLRSTTVINLSSAIIVIGALALQLSNGFSSSKNEEMVQERGCA